MRRVLAVAGILGLAASEAGAWPTTLMQCLGRDARRLVPHSLAVLMAEREDKVFEEMTRFPIPLSQALASDLSGGQLQPETVASLDAYMAETVEIIRSGKVSEGVVRLGAMLRIPADLSDPVLSAGAEGYPAGVVREYYSFIEVNLNKIPVVLDDPPALKLRRAELPAYWQRILGRSRSQSPVIGTELFQQGRIVSHKLIDYRSPVFGVASLSYSRAVTAVAATWLSLWREANGDVTRMPRPIDVSTDKPAPATLPARPYPYPEARRP